MALCDLKDIKKNMFHAGNSENRWGSSGALMMYREKIFPFGWGREITRNFLCGRFLAGTTSFGACEPLEAAHGCVVARRSA